MHNVVQRPNLYINSGIAWVLQRIKIGFYLALLYLCLWIKGIYKISLETKAQEALCCQLWKLGRSTTGGSLNSAFVFCKNPTVIKNRFKEWIWDWGGCFKNPLLGAAGNMCPAVRSRCRLLSGGLGWTPRQPASSIGEGWGWGHVRTEQQVSASSNERLLSSMLKMMKRKRRMRHWTSANLYMEMRVIQLELREPLKGNEWGGSSPEKQVLLRFWPIVYITLLKGNEWGRSSPE